MLRFAQVFLYRFDQRSCLWDGNCEESCFGFSAVNAGGFKSQPGSKLTTNLAMGVCISKLPSCSTYICLNTLGIGSSGHVSRRFNKKSLSIVAVKVISKNNKFYDVDMIRNEIEIMRDLKHQNLVELRGAAEKEDKFYIELEYVEGKMLKTIIREASRLVEHEGKNIFRQVLDGIHFLHSKNIVHLDIKTSNIIVKNNGTVKIIDFGLSKKVLDGEEIYLLSGTPKFVAPEVGSPKCIDPFKADIWGMGVTLIHMYSVYLRTIKTTLATYIADHRNRLREDLDDLSEECKDLIVKMCAYSPDNRPSTTAILNHPWLENV